MNNQMTKIKGQAIRPETFIQQLPSLQKAEKVNESITDEEKHLYALSNHAGWKALKEYIDRVLTDLDSLNTNAMSQGANFENIGQNAVIITTTKEVIKKILNKVSDAKEASENKDTAK